MKTKRIAAKLLCLILCVIMGGEMILSALCITASAAEVGGYDNTTIESDLGDRVAEYHKQLTGDCEIISFMEYAYTEKPNLSKNYGLYFYVYNPTGKAISILDDVNAVNILIGNGKANDGYSDKIYLEYLDKTEDNLIYKFKLDNAYASYLIASEYAREHEGKREYTISELEVKYADGIKAYNVDKKYSFTGYGAYLGNDDSPESTLQCLDYTASSLKLEVKQTNYRGELRPAPGSLTDVTSSGNITDYSYVADDVSSVYFKIPASYYNQLQYHLSAVSAEWYEYKTQPIYVTSDKDAYEALKPLRNTTINEFGKRVDSNGSVLEDIVLSYWRILFDEVLTMVRISETNTYKHYFRQAFNAKPRERDFNDIENGIGYSRGYTFGYYNNDENTWNAVSEIHWLFECGDFNSENPYMVPRSALLTYMKEYSNTFGSHDIRGKYSSNLFVDSIDTDRLSLLDANRLKDDKGNYVKNADGTYQLIDGASVTNGLVKMKFTNDSKESFVDRVDTTGAWEKFWYGESKMGTKDFEPIATLGAEALAFSNAEFAERYFVNTQDVPDIKKELQSAIDNDEKLILLRFAVTDYSVKNARFDYVEEKTDDVSEQDGYVAQETAFLDFDVISLEFSDREGVVREVIAVVAEPIDIIHGLTPPETLVEEQEWWIKLVGLIMVVIILLVLYMVVNTYIPWLGAIIRLVVGALWWAFTGLLKLVTWPLRALFSELGRKARRKFKLRSPRGKRKGKRGRPQKKQKKTKKQSRNQKMMKNAAEEIKAKASETFANIKAKASEKISNIRNKKE